MSVPRSSHPASSDCAPNSADPLQELKKRHEDEKSRLEQLFLKEQAGRREDQVPRPRPPRGHDGA